MPHTDDKTVLLLHCDGSNNGTSFVDSCSIPKTVTRYNAVTKTDSYKFNGSSGYFNGTSAYLTLDPSSDWVFGTSPFTIDMWVYLSSNDHAEYDFIRRDCWAGDVERDIMMMLNPSESSGLKFGVPAGSSWATTKSIPIQQWTHLMVSRNDAYLYLGIDGEVQAFNIGASFSFGGSPSSGPPLGIGAVPAYSGVTAQAFMDGYIDEVRISKGVARWTSNFIPPNEQYYSGIPSSYISGNRSRLHRKGVSTYNQLV